MSKFLQEKTPNNIYAHFLLLDLQIVQLNSRDHVIAPARANGQLLLAVKDCVDVAF